MAKAKQTQVEQKNPLIAVWEQIGGQEIRGLRVIGRNYSNELQGIALVLESGHWLTLTADTDAYDRAMLNVAVTEPEKVEEWTL